MTPLIGACQHNHVQVVWLLLEANADKNKASISQTPLFAACHNNNTEEVVQLLLEARADKEKEAGLLLRNLN